MKKIMVKSGNFVSWEKWEQCHSQCFMWCRWSISTGTWRRSFVSALPLNQFWRGKKCGCHKLFLSLFQIKDPSIKLGIDYVLIQISSKVIFTKLAWNKFHSDWKTLHLNKMSQEFCPLCIKTVWVIWMGEIDPSHSLAYDPANNKDRSTLNNWYQRDIEEGNNHNIYWTGMVNQKHSILSIRQSIDFVHFSIVYKGILKILARWKQLQATTWRCEIHESKRTCPTKHAKFKESKWPETLLPAATKLWPR